MVPAMQLPIRTEYPDKERSTGDGMNRLGMADSVTQASGMREGDAGLSCTLTTIIQDGAGAASLPGTRLSHCLPRAFWLAIVGYSDPI